MVSLPKSGVRSALSQQLVVDDLPAVLALGNSARGIEYPPHSTANWVQTDPSPIRGMDPQSDLSLQGWHVNAQDLPVTQSFAPYGQGQNLPLHGWQPGVTDPREDISWSLPQRSASYGNLESLHGNHYSTYPQPTAQHIANPYPPKHAGQHTAMYQQAISASPTALSEISPTAADNLPPTAYNAWQQPYASMEPNGPAYGPWSGAGRPSQMVEAANQVPSQYTYAEPPSGSYYPPPPSSRS